MWAYLNNLAVLMSINAILAVTLGGTLLTGGRFSLAGSVRVVGEDIETAAGWDVALLAASVLPGLQDCIVTSKVTTPQDFQDRLWSYKGAGFGLEPLLLQSAWFRPHNRSEDIPGLYVVGASTHPGAGVPGVLMSAKALETVVPHVQL